MYSLSQPAATVPGFPQGLGKIPEVPKWQIGLQRRGPDDDSAEKEKQVQRACIRFYGSSYSGQSMDSNCIWCNVDDLRNLAQALDRLNFKEDQ